MTALSRPFKDNHDAYIHTHTHKHRRARAHTHTCRHARTHTHTHAHTHTHRRTHTHTRARTHPPTVARTHVHTLSLSLSLSEHGGRTLDSGGGKFQRLTIFLGILRSEAMPASSEQLRAAVASFVTIFRNLMADRAKTASALRIHTLTVPLKVRASDVLVLFFNRTTAQVW